MATLSEHVDRIKAAIEAARADGFTVEMDDNGASCCSISDSLTLDIYKSDDYSTYVEIARNE